MDVAGVTIGNRRVTVQVIQCKAKAHGTFNSPSDGQIKYVDPDNADEQYHSPKLTPAEAKVAFERGLIEDPDGASTSDMETSATQTDDRVLKQQIGAVAAENTAEFAAEDDEGGVGSGTLDSRSSTAWADRERVQGGADGFADGIMQKPADQQAIDASGATATDVDQVSGDADAPPAPRRRGRTAGSQAPAPASDAGDQTKDGDAAAQ